MISRFALLLLCLALPAHGQPTPAQAASPETGKTFAPVTLRGYGTVSGELKKQAEGSVLTIACESEDKAKLLQAKYLSDLMVLPGVSEKKGSPTMYEAAGQGVIAAWQDGKTVSILAAKDGKALQALATSTGVKGSTEAQVDVPMYLDRWDKFGWRFYYRPWATPAGETVKTFDFLKDFDDAKALDRSGLMVASSPSQLNTTQGLREESTTSWVVEAANQRGLPIGMNITTEAYGFPNWLTNLHPYDVQGKMPQFSGNIYRIADGYLGARGTPSWSSDALYDAALGSVQDSVRHFRQIPSVTSFLEPHGELNHGKQDLFLEYGPLADKTFREYLKENHDTLDSLSQRWFGAPGKIASWDQVRVPELASFAGWNRRAVDLQGLWAVGYEKLEDPSLVLDRSQNDAFYFKNVPTKPAPKEWFAPGFNDTSWPRMLAPGDDQTMLMGHRPAVFRRTFDLSAVTLKSSPRWWLYVWDLNDAANDKVVAYINGQKAGESDVRRPLPHRGAFEVTKFLRPGRNQISLRLPKGFLAYRVYLSPDEPLEYPRLGEGKNALWADFVGWMNWTRARQVRRGMEMIRQVEPDRGIVMMSPDYYADTVKSAAKDFGGDFHNTGYMAAFYADSLPRWMNGAGLPFSLEPGGPAKDVLEFKRFLGLWLTENVQGVDYFINAGDVLWNPDIRKNYEDNLNLYHLFGKFHAPRGEFAVLFSNQARLLTDYPWGDDPNAIQPAGLSNWNISGFLRPKYEYSFLSESSFGMGDAGKFRIIIDSNNSILSDKLVDEIEQWVKDGGIFITSGQSGRHTPEKYNAWPISRLTGYETVRIDKFLPDGKPQDLHTLSMAPGQTVLPDTWNGVRSNGLGLKKIAPDATDILLWDDGTTAMGMRPLGKGWVIQVGPIFGNARIPDRIEGVGDNVAEQYQRLEDLYTQLLAYFKVPPSEASTPEKLVFARHFLSNNGLYDIWMLWNESDNDATTDLNFTPAVIARSVRDISTGQILPVKNGSVKNLSFEPMQPRGFLSPRARIEDAPASWFALQRDWWQGTTPPSDRKFPDAQELQTTSLPLSRDWAFKPVAAGEDASALAASDFDDSAWKRFQLTIWTPWYPGVKHGIFRKKFRVPEKWTAGDIALSVQSWNPPTFMDQANIWLDGQLISKNNTSSLNALKLPNLLPGSEHLLAVEIQGSSPMAGTKGEAWLDYLPRPAASLDLAGQWLTSKDALHYDGKATLPGAWDNIWVAKRRFMLDKAYAGASVFVHFAGTADLTGVIINGRWVRQDHHQVAKEWLINITPWVKFGAMNEIQVARLNGLSKGTVSVLRLDLFKPGTYP